jgi:predicted glycosyltransferase
MIQPPRKDPRFLLYSHDSFGLGHLRRSLTLSEGLLESFPQAELLVVTGSPCASLFAIPAGAGLVKLPSVTKNDDGSYVPRTLGTSLERLRRIRKGLLLESFRAFRPDLIIVDHKVIGWSGEAFELLQAARAEGVRTLLGIRDIIDSSEAVAQEWDDDKSRWALAEGYDCVCVYGVPEVFDPTIEYPIPSELSERVEFTGYVANLRNSSHRHPVPAMRPRVLVTMGGGEDGARRLNIYLEGIERQRAPWDTVLVSGPLLNDSEARRIRRRARMIGNVEVRRFYSDMPRLMSECDAVVSMAGYNTCTEIMQSGKPWVLLPRTHPRMEQAIRAERLSKLGLAAQLPDPKPDDLRIAVQAALDRVQMPTDPIPSLDGVQRVCAIAADLLGMRVTLPKAARERATQEVVS